MKSNQAHGAQYSISRTANGRLKLSLIGDFPPNAKFRLAKASGESFLLESGFVEGDIINERVFEELENRGHLYPPPGSVSGASLKLSWHVQRHLARSDQPLNVTNRSHANRLGWRQDVTRIRRQGRAKVRELAFAESTQELYFRVCSSDSDKMVTYHLIETAIPTLLEHGIMVGDQIDPELQYELTSCGHLYTESSGQTGF